MSFFFFPSLSSTFHSYKWRSHLQVIPLPLVLFKHFLKMYLHTSNTHNPCRLDLHEQLLSEPWVGSPSSHPLPPLGSCVPKASWAQLPGCHGSAVGLGGILDKLTPLQEALLPVNTCSWHDFRPLAHLNYPTRASFEAGIVDRRPIRMVPTTVSPRTLPRKCFTRKMLPCFGMLVGSAFSHYWPARVLTSLKQRLPSGVPAALDCVCPSAPSLHLRTMLKSSIQQLCMLERSVLPPDPFLYDSGHNGGRMGTGGSTPGLWVSFQVVTSPSYLRYFQKKTVDSLESSNSTIL